MCVTVNLEEVYCGNCRKIIGYAQSDTLIEGFIYCPECAEGYP